MTNTPICQGKNWEQSRVHSEEGILPARVSWPCNGRRSFLTGLPFLFSERNAFIQFYGSGLRLEGSPLSFIHPCHSGNWDLEAGPKKGHRIFCWCKFEISGAFQTQRLAQTSHFLAIQFSKNLLDFFHLFLGRNIPQFPPPGNIPEFLVHCASDPVLLAT